MSQKLMNGCARFIFALALALAGSARAPADDWPQWLGPERDGVWRETGIVDKFPAGGPPVRWRATLNAGYSGPAVAEGRVYVTDRILAKDAKNPANAFQRGNVPGTERVLCFSEADGKPLWTHQYDCPYTVSYPLGPRTTPVVKDGKAYTFGTEGNLLCLNSGTGKVVWSRDLKKDYGVKAPMWGFSAHPLLDGPRLICMVGGEGSTVVAFDKDTGKEIWKGLTAREPGYCPPMIYEAGGKRQLIVWHAEALVSLDPETGKVYWSEPVSAYAAMSIPTPRKLGDRLFITSAMNTAMLLRLATDRPHAEVVWSKNKQQEAMHSVFSTPFFEDGYLYGCTNDGELVCLKADSGERVWGTMAPNNNQKARSGDTFLVKNGDRFFLVTEKGDLIIAKLSPKGYEEISRAHLLDATSSAWGRQVLWSHPAFANRSVFARNDKELICVSLATAPGG
jgi:outer membrane protein assembly factor BamB